MLGEGGTVAEPRREGCVHLVASLGVHEPQLLVEAEDHHDAAEWRLEPRQGDPRALDVACDSEHLARQRRMRPAGGHFPRTQLRPVTPHLERLPWPVGHDASLARLARALGGFAPLPQLLPEPANRLGLLALGGAVELDELQEQIWILRRIFRQMP